MAETGGLKQQKLMFSLFRRLKIPDKVPAEVVSDKASLPGLQMSFWLYPHLAFSLRVPTSGVSPSFFKKNDLFIYFWLHWSSLLCADFL